jgi:Asp-tRNA(Asn)/Glu-tRNA(Gln) amidotransferase A subunit family amidase
LAASRSRAIPIGPRPTPFLDEVGRDPKPLRIAFTTAGFAVDGIDPECAQAVRDAARLCESLGHQVEEAAPPIDRAAFAGAGVVISASVAADLDTVAGDRGRPISEDEVEPVTWNSYQRGQRVTGSAYIRGLRASHAYGRAMADFFQRYDILICATLGRPPVPVGWLKGDPPDYAGYVDRLFSFMPNTQPFNLTGQPAASIPLAMSKGGLPIGVQFVARQAEDALLLSLAGQLERAAPWVGRRAPL